MYWVNLELNRREKVIISNRYSLVEYKIQPPLPCSVMTDEGVMYFRD